MATVDGSPFEAAARRERRIGHAVEVHAAIGSTNDRARELLVRDGVEGVAVVAELQTSGRGRRGRTWTSPPGRNLMVSVAARPRIAAAAAWQVACAAAIAGCDACRSVAPVYLKWPNDLIDDEGRKLGGLLIETVVDGDRLTHVVIGVGINVNWRLAEMPPELRRAATSLLELAGGPVDRVALLARLLDALDGELAALEAGRSPLGRYRERCATLGSEVTVDAGDRVLSGVASDVDDEGRLVVVTADGERVAVAGGEVVRLRPFRAPETATPSAPEVVS